MHWMGMLSKRSSVLRMIIWVVDLEAENLTVAHQVEEVFRGQHLQVSCSVKQSRSDVFRSFDVIIYASPADSLATTFASYGCFIMLLNTLRLEQTIHESKQRCTTNATQLVVWTLEIQVALKQRGRNFSRDCT